MLFFFEAAPGMMVRPKDRSFRSSSQTRICAGFSPLMDWTGTSQKAKRDQQLSTVIASHAVLYVYRPTDDFPLANKILR
jgi:hypothetical protein